MVLDLSLVMSFDHQPMNGLHSAKYVLLSVNGTQCFHGNCSTEPFVFEHAQNIITSAVKHGLFP